MCLFDISLMLTAPLCKWFWSGLSRCLNTEPHMVFGAIGVDKLRILVGILRVAYCMYFPHGICQGSKLHPYT